MAGHDSAGEIALIPHQYYEQGALLDARSRPIIWAAGRLMGFVGTKHIDDEDFTRPRLLRVLAIFYGDDLSSRADKLCRTDKALRALLDPPQYKPTAKESKYVNAREARLLCLEAYVARQKLRSISRQVWAKFERFPLASYGLMANMGDIGAPDSEVGLNVRQDRLARAFGINVYRWDSTATLKRLQNLWHMISDDPFPA